MMKNLSVFVAILLVVFSFFALVVDSVAIIITYLSIVFALLAIRGGNKKMLKTYGLLFFVAHMLFLWRVTSDMSS